MTKFAGGGASDLFDGGLAGGVGAVNPSTPALTKAWPNVGKEVVRSDIEDAGQTR